MLRRLSRLPLGMVRWFARLVKRLVRFALVTAVIAFVLLVLDALLLRDTSRQEPPE